MRSLAYDLAKSELDLLLDCVVCNQVTATTAKAYQERVSTIVTEALAEAPSEEHKDLQQLEATASTYIEQQIDRFDNILKTDKSAVSIYTAFASVPGTSVDIDKHITVPSTYHVTLSRLDNSRLKRIIEASENVPCALSVIKSMSEVTASSVSYDLSPDSLSFIRRVVAGLSQDRTAKSLKKAFGTLL